jgi:glycine/D-amino acid oxidase-like deaminating enzyme
MKKTTWQKDVTMPEYPVLPGNVVTDVAIIGGGMTGTISAYLIAKSGRRVVVIDKSERFETGATACTTAFLASDVDTALSDLKAMFGTRRANDVWRSHGDSIEMIERIIKEEGIECDFMRVPEYWVATSDSGLKELHDEAREGRAAGFDIWDVPREKMPFKNSGVMALQEQGKFHPLKFMAAMQKKAEAYGAKFYSRTTAEHIEGDEPVHIRTDHGNITAGHVIIATYLSIENPPRIFGKKGMYVSYVYELSIPKHVIPEGLYLDDQNPYHYFRVDKNAGEDGRDRMIIGGEDHRIELPPMEDKQFGALKAYLDERFQGIEYKIVSSWTGPILETLDGLPYIGRPAHDRPHLLVATGFSGNGMTYAMTAGRILAGIIDGHRSRYEDTFSPYREVTIKGIVYKTRDYVGELIHGYLKNIV